MQVKECEENNNTACHPSQGMHKYHMKFGLVVLGLLTFVQLTSSKPLATIVPVPDFLFPATLIFLLSFYLLLSSEMMAYKFQSSVA